MKLKDCPDNSYLSVTYVSENQQTELLVIITLL